MRNRSTMAGKKGLATEILIYLLLVLALTLGGGSIKPNGRIFIICLVSAALFASAVSFRGWAAFGKLSGLTRVALLLIVIVPLVQLIPLPPGLWASLPGRELPDTIFGLVGAADAWRPLSLTPRNTLFALLMLLPPFAMFFGVLTLDDRAKTRAVAVFLGIAAISILVGLVQLGSRGSEFDFYGSAHRWNLIGFFANRNHQGLMLAVAAVMSIAFVHRRFRDRRTAIAWALLLSITFVVAAVGTISRAALGLMLAGLAGSIYMHFFRGIGRRHLGLSIAAMAAAALVLYLLTFSSVVGMALARFSEVGENDRWDLWRYTWPLVSQYGAWGSGLGSFVTAYAAIETLNSVTPNYINHAHNDYLELLIETGLVGLAVLAIFILAILVRLVGVARGKQAFGVFGAPAALALLLVGIHSFVDYPLRTPAMTVIFALLLALFFSKPDDAALADNAQQDPPVLEQTGTTEGARALSPTWRVGTAVLVFLLLVAFTIFACSKRLDGRIKVDPAWPLTAIRDAEIPSAVVERTRELLAEQPLDQPLLNFLFAAESRGDMKPERRAEFVDALSKLGWRDTPSQQNLIFEAVQSGKPAEAVLRADALLRRGKLTDHIIPVLIQMEADPDAVALLIDRLAKNPGWRGGYFAIGAPLHNPAVLDARVRLFDRMLKDGIPLSRREIKSSIEVMLRQGRRQEAADIAMRASGIKVGQAMIYDADFTNFLALNSEERNEVLPFEWEVSSRPGVSTQISANSGAGQMAIRWNGLGVPVLARTMAMLGETRQPRLEIVASSRQAFANLSILAFALRCPGQAAVPFVADGSDESRNAALYRADAAVACGNPDLVILGRPQGRDATVETALRSVRLLP